MGKKSPTQPSPIIGSESLKTVQEKQHLQDLLDREVRKNQKLNAELSRQREREKEFRRLENRLTLLERLDNLVTVPPKWTQKPTKKGALHRGIPTIMVSDLHLDEVVNPDEVEGVNEYNREIAVRRLRRVLAGSISVCREHFSGLRYEGFTLILGGDIFSGSIHEELEITNEDTVIGSLDFWLDHLAAFVSGILEAFGRVHVVGVVGNHGRNTRKPRAKLRVRDNFDWLLYRQIARYFKNDSHITFQIPESADADVRIYDTSYRVTHGDQFRGGSGISGMMAPLMLGHSRKSQRQMALNKPYDWMVMGHWHTYWTGRGLIVNGSMKGYDEFAYVQNYTYEPPQQALWITVPERIGPTFPAPIFAEPSKK